MKPLLMEAGRACIVAEVGPNHDGDLGRAVDLIHRIAEAGADAVKFQTYKAAAAVVAKNAPLADYMKAGGDWGDQEILLDSVRLTREDFDTVAAECEKAGITFLSTPFDEDSVDFLLGLGMPAIKVPSGEITNPFLLRHVARTGKPLIVSTGMATLAEVGACLDLIRAEWTKAGIEERTGLVTLLHCTSSYPTDLPDANLRAMDALREAYNLPTGFSDHTLGMTAPLAAVARGAVLIEKHVSPDPTLPGPDHAASLSLDLLPDLVREVRRIETALGRHGKEPVEAERNVALVARRSVCAARDIAAGEIFATGMLNALRPETGIPAMRADELIGRTAKRAYSAGELIDRGELDEA